MTPVTAFSKLRTQSDSASLEPDPLNHYIASMATNKQPVWLNAADEMSEHICCYSLEQQNEILLRIQDRLISYRMNIIEKMEIQLRDLTVELDHARAALRSIAG